MRIVAVVGSSGLTGFYNDDQEAIRQGAEEDGFVYVGEPKTAGFTAIRQRGESVSIMLVLDDGQVAYGDCSTVQYAGVCDRDTPLSSADTLRLIEDELADRLVGRRFADVADVLGLLADEAPSDLRGIVHAVADAAADVREERVHQVFVGGQSSLVDDVSLQRDELARLLQLLEERETLARMLEETVEGPEPGAPTVRIGEEHPNADLRTTSLVAQRYRLVSSGSLGVLGPTRMDYGSALATVRAVSDELQRTLDALAEHG